MSAARIIVWSDDDCRRVHEATLHVLARTGIDVRYEPALEVFAAAGGRVDGARVRLDAAVVDKALASAPRTWTVRSRGRDEALELRNGNTYFGTGSDCLYFSDPDSGERRRVRSADVELMAALAEKLPHIDFVMSMGLPEDAPLRVDDLTAVRAMLAGTRKPLMVAPRNGFVVEAIREMCAAAGAADSFMIYAMPSPPLMHDKDGLSKLRACAEHDVPVIWAPAPNAGSTAPRSVAATAVIGNAEVLAGLVFHQQVKPGAPFVWGVGVGAMDMRTAVDAYTTPESPLGQAAEQDLCRWYGLPSFDYAAMSDSKVMDQQFALEYGLTAMSGGLARGTLVHDVGYLESGLQSSCESIVFGDAAIGWAKAFMRDVATDDEAIALDEIMEVGPGGNHLARKYTRNHLRDFWYDDLFDHTVYDRWAAAGRQTMLDRVKARVAELRSERAFTLDPAALARIDEIMRVAGQEREE
jgi:trimethylamine---corrinoid protein Co-methyltransferase